MDTYREVEFEIPFHIRSPDGFENPGVEFFPRIKGYPVGLRFQSRTNEQLNLGGMATVRRDRYGNAVHSAVRARFHPKFEQLVPDSLPDKGVYPAGRWLGDRNGRYIDFAVLALNRFIEIYREEAGSYWIRPLRPGDIVEFEIRDFVDGELKNTIERSVTLGGAVIGGMGEEDLQKIEQRLEAESQPNIYQTLHLDIQERIDQDEYSVAILLAYALFERWIKNAFVVAVSSNGPSRTEARGLIKKDDGKYISLWNILVNCVEHHTDVKFKDSTRFDTWESQLHEERNKVVHKDYQPNKQSAHQAHYTAIDTITWFQDQFNPSIEGEPENVDFVEVREIDDSSG